MSARSVIEHALTVYYDGDAKLAGKVIDQYRDGYAHELAEKQRESAREAYSRTIAAMGVERAGAWILGHDRAAKLIDPEGPGA